MTKHTNSHLILNLFFFILARRGGDSIAPRCAGPFVASVIYSLLRFCQSYNLCDIVVRGQSDEDDAFILPTSREEETSGNTEIDRLWLYAQKRSYVHTGTLASRMRTSTRGDTCTLVRRSSRKRATFIPAALATGKTKSRVKRTRITMTEYFGAGST